MPPGSKKRAKQKAAATSGPASDVSVVPPPPPEKEPVSSNSTPTKITKSPSIGKMIIDTLRNVNQTPPKKAAADKVPRTKSSDRGASAEKVSRSKSGKESSLGDIREELTAKFGMGRSASKKAAAEEGSPVSVVASVAASSSASSDHGEPVASPEMKAVVASDVFCKLEDVAATAAPGAFEKLTETEAVVVEESAEPVEAAKEAEAEADGKASGGTSESGNFESLLDDALEGFIKVPAAKQGAAEPESAAEPRSTAAASPGKPEVIADVATVAAGLSLDATAVKSTDDKAADAVLDGEEAPAAPADASIVAISATSIEVEIESAPAAAIPAALAEPIAPATPVADPPALAPISDDDSKAVVLPSRDAPADSQEEAEPLSCTGVVWWFFFGKGKAKQ